MTCRRWILPTILLAVFSINVAGEPDDANIAAPKITASREQWSNHICFAIGVVAGCSANNSLGKELQADSKKFLSQFTDALKRADETSEKTFSDEQGPPLFIGLLAGGLGGLLAGSYFYNEAENYTKETYDEPEDETQKNVYRGRLFSPEGRQYLLYSDYTIDVGNTETLEIMLILSLPGRPKLSNVTFWPEGRISAIAAGAFHLWDSQTGKKLQEFGGHEEGERKFVPLLPSGLQSPQFATYHPYNGARFYDGLTGDPGISISPPCPNIETFVLCPDQKTILGISKSSGCLFNAYTGARIRRALKYLKK
jgi:WD40 repeat protein